MTELFVADYLERFHNCLQVFQEKHKNFRTFKKKKKRKCQKVDPPENVLVVKANSDCKS